MSNIAGALAFGLALIFASVALAFIAMLALGAIGIPVPIAYLGGCTVGALAFVIVTDRL